MEFDQNDEYLGNCNSINQKNSISHINNKKLINYTCFDHIFCISTRQATKTKWKQFYHGEEVSLMVLLQLIGFHHAMFLLTGYLKQYVG